VDVARQPPREAVLEALAQTLAPYLGQTMAQAALETHRHKLGSDGPFVTTDQLDALLAKLSAGLVIFVGRERTEVVIRQARSAVGALPVPS
jgi:hypothetical protein